MSSFIAVDCATLSLWQRRQTETTFPWGQLASRLDKCAFALPHYAERRKHQVAFYYLFTKYSSWASWRACSHCHSAFVIVKLLFSGKVAFHVPPPTPLQTSEWPVCPLAQFPPHGLICTWHCLRACTRVAARGQDHTEILFGGHRDLFNRILGCVWGRNGIPSEAWWWSADPNTGRLLVRALARSHHRPKIESIVLRVGLHSSHAELCDN